MSRGAVPSALFALASPKAAITKDHKLGTYHDRRGCSPSLEAGAQNQDDSRAVLPLGALGRVLPHLSGVWGLQAYRRIPPGSVSVCPRPSLCVSSLLSIRMALGVGCRAHPANFRWFPLRILSSVTSAKTLFPQGAICTSSGGWEVDLFWGWGAPLSPLEGGRGTMICGTFNRQVSTSPDLLRAPFEAGHVH